MSAAAVDPSQLTSEEEENVSSVFQRFQRDGHYLDTFDLRQALSETGHPATEEELINLIRLHDVDGTGHFSYETFVEVVRGQKLAAQREVAADIDTIDAFVAMGGNPDKTGTITSKLLIETCKKFKLTINIEELIAETDRDGSGFIDYDEFSLMLND